MIKPTYEDCLIANNRKINTIPVISILVLGTIQVIAILVLRPSKYYRHAFSKVADMML